MDSVIAAVQHWMPDAQGITISGGEPFDQPDALRVLLQKLRGISGGDVLVYSGYLFNELTEWLDANSGLVDVLISGPYQERSGQSFRLRGSDNQTLHFLTELGRERFSSFDHGGRGIRNQLEAHLINPLARALFEQDSTSGRYQIEALESGTTTTLKLVKA